MSEGQDEQLARDLAGGAPRAFEALYLRYQTAIRMAAFRICRRADWIDDVSNEAWRRGYEARGSYDPARPFLVWLTGILRNVCREQRRSRQATGGENIPEEIDRLDPAEIAAEAEVLVALDECVQALSEEDQQLVRMRFFEGRPLRAVAEALRAPEATIRETRLPAALNRLKMCLRHKGLDISRIFSAQGAVENQGKGRERE